MNYNHPYSSNGRFYFYTTPIVPALGGIVVEAPIREAGDVKKGDVLFRIDPTPYEAVVSQKKAALAEAGRTVKQLSASREASGARLTAGLAAAVLNLDRPPSVPGRFLRARVKRVEGADRPGADASPPVLWSIQRRSKGRRASSLCWPARMISRLTILCRGRRARQRSTSEHLHHLAIMRKVLLRMNSWTNYLFSDGH